MAKRTTPVPDGGVVALTGFIVQCMSALLLSLESDDWKSFEVEPVKDDDTYQKVDIVWTMKDDRTRVAQVKHSKNNITVPTAKRWATSLKRSKSGADILMLLLYAPTTGNVPDLETWQGVRIITENGDVDMLWDVLIVRFLKFYRPIALCEVSDAYEIMLNMVAIVIVTAIDGTVWTPDKLRDQLVVYAGGLERVRLAAGANLNLPVTFRRVIKCMANGQCLEYIRYSFKNYGATEIPLPGWEVVCTEMEGLEFLRVTVQGSVNPTCETYSQRETNSVMLRITPGTVVPPMSASSIEVWFSRQDNTVCVDRRADVWMFTDRLLPTVKPQLANIYLIFPMEGKIAAEAAAGGAVTVYSQIVHWDLSTGAQLQTLSASMHKRAKARPSNPQLLDDLNRHFLP